MALTSAQLLTLKTAIIAELDPTFVTYRTNGQNTLMADWFNVTATPNFTVWKTNVSRNEVGKTFVATALAAITAGNNDKLANFAAWNETVDPSRTDQRAFFDDVFSVAAGASTRAALLVLWKRLATRGEKLFANTSSGNGADATPASLVFQGNITDFDVQTALAS